MDALVYILVIGTALIAVVAVMVVILREKREEDAHHRYVRSPWREQTDASHTEPVAPPEMAGTVAEPPVDPVVPEDPGTPGAHTPVSEPVTPDDEKTNA